MQCTNIKAPTLEILKVKRVEMQRHGWYPATDPRKIPMTFNRERSEFYHQMMCKK